MERCVGEEAIAQVKSVDEGLREKMGEVRLTRRFLKLEKPFSVDVWLALSGRMRQMKWRSSTVL